MSADLTAIESIATSAEKVWNDNWATKTRFAESRNWSPELQEAQLLAIETLSANVVALSEALRDAQIQINELKNRR